MKIVQIEELGQGSFEAERFRDYVNVGIHASGQGRTLYIYNPNGISINVMVSTDKMNWTLGSMNGTTLTVTSTQHIPVNNYGQWIQLQVADDANVTGVIANIL